MLLQRILPADTGRDLFVHLKRADEGAAIAAIVPHRAEAFDACRYIIDTLKTTVPIWKKEVATDGEEWVEG